MARRKWLFAPLDMAVGYILNHDDIPTACGRWLWDYHSERCEPWWDAMTEL